MEGAPHSGDPHHHHACQQVASGSHVGVAPASYADLAERLFANGYEPIPVRPRSKAVAAREWTNGPITAARVEAWCQSFGECGIGLRTGRIVGLDIDSLDPDVAHDLAARAIGMFGDTLVRVGRWPKRLLIYRNDAPLPKLGLPRLDILGLGQQFVAYGIHPDTGSRYEWVTGDTPCDVAADQLPIIDAAGLQIYLAEAAALTAHLSDTQRPRRGRPSAPSQSPGPARNAQGRVSDGRDAWLSTIAFHAVHDALDHDETLDPQRLASLAWERFTATSDLARPRKDGQQPWSMQDAARKVRDKLELRAHGRLPDRDEEAVQPEDLGALLPLSEARAQLGHAIGQALSSAETWWCGERRTAAPVAGIRATVGLGKSAVAREQITAWQTRMRGQGLPHRVLVVTPSHALAEEAAQDWAARVDGKVAVLRGYEAHHPSLHVPMCRDLDMVQLALRERVSVGRSACYASKTWQCPHYTGCPKQQNKRDVAAADVILAPYDVLFTGPAAGAAPIGLIVIDEGCWQRAEHALRGPPVERFAKVGLSSGLRPDDPTAAAVMADLAAVRMMAQVALGANGPGPVIAMPLLESGLSAKDCRWAAEWEERCIRDPEIYPGMKLHLRKVAMAVIRRNETARRMAAIWRALAMIIAGEHHASGLLRILAPDPDTGQHGLVLHDHRRLADALAGLPILHLDATLRPDLAQCLLPGLKVIRIDAEQPHMHLTLVVGRFAKSTIAPAPNLAQDELKRRQNRLREIVDHVRWEARRTAPGQVLVVTHMGIEHAFAGIEGVQTAHFNAIAGLDQYRDVRLLIVVGRPLPSNEALVPLAASFFHRLPEGCYRPEWRAVRLRSGGAARLRVVAHPDSRGELLRAAICDDELIQAIGRGRGVNRSAATPLEVQVLADVALPLIHDRVVAWESLVPDIVQRMLFGGIAVDSPTDAALLHPHIFASSRSAEGLFGRIGFNTQTPIGNTYRGMGVKSARYRRGGRGRSWQLCWWMEGDADLARARLEQTLGVLAGWEVA